MFGYFAGNNSYSRSNTEQTGLWRKEKSVKQRTLPCRKNSFLTLMLTFHFLVRNPSESSLETLQLQTGHFSFFPFCPLTYSVDLPFQERNKFLFTLSAFIRLFITLLHKPFSELLQPREKTSRFYYFTTGDQQLQETEEPMGKLFMTAFTTLCLFGFCFFYENNPEATAKGEKGMYLV